MSRSNLGALQASLTGLGALALAGQVTANVTTCGTGTANSPVVIAADIIAATTWTKANTYDLNGIIHVRPGASLTIEAGTVLASDTDGVLVVCRGAQITVQANTDCPVIMTSKQDRATWTAGNPYTGAWREGANEWGNLTILGRGVLSENVPATNTPTPSSSNVALMEGLTSGDPDHFYGGGDDDDDSGTVKFLQIRFGGQQALSPTVELNGFALGGVGRDTDISYVEVMNNVDDGLEIWGGTVNLKYMSVWNVGDDYFDIDQGWRGKLQFALLVQGYSIDGGAIGGGQADNGLELDGAEACWYQPWTTAQLWNMTVIGQPLAGRDGTNWRDNARVQIKNSIFMDLGRDLVRLGDPGGDGGGYGCLADATNPATATPTWAAWWAMPFNAMPAYPSSDPGATDPTITLATLYGQTFTSGFMCQIANSLFFRNTVGTNPTTGNTGTTGDPAYAEALARGVFTAAMNNAIIPGQNFADNTAAPIQNIVRAAAGPPLSTLQRRVITLDPRPKNAALSTTRRAPQDGFFTSAGYIGAFKPATTGVNEVWLRGWSASATFGIVVTTDPSVGVPTCFGDGSSSGLCGCNNLGGAGEGCAHGFGQGIGAQLTASGNPSTTADTLVLTAHEISNQPGLFFQGNNSIANGKGANFGDGLRCCGGNVVRLQLTDPPGAAALHISGSTNVTISNQGTNPTSLVPGVTRCYQYWYRTPGVWSECGTNFNLSNSVVITWLP